MRRLGFKGWVLLSLFVGAPTAFADSPAAGHALELGVVLNPLWQSRELAQSPAASGLGLGHSELSLELGLGSGSRARLSVVGHSDGSRVETELEEAFLDLPVLPRGWQLRAGRFLSQVGYLNEQHLHSDDFATRPVLHRALLGGHYFDDGLRLNWIAPTELFWRIGAELLRGRRLSDGETDRALGAWTLSSRVGGDMGRSSSWQVGLSTLRHSGTALSQTPEPVQWHDSGPAHSHQSGFFGRQLDILDVVWKWAPGGNNAVRHLRLSAEFARVGAWSDEIAAGPRHRAAYLAVAYRFAAQWEAAIRLDRLEAWAVHESGFESARLAERALSLSWKPSHSRTFRVQWSGQRDLGGFAEIAGALPTRALHLQFVQSFGAHGAHSY